MDFTPMIDVTFQLLIFFMLTIKFKTLEGKFATLLPDDRCVNPRPLVVDEDPWIVRLRVLPEDAARPSAERRVVFSTAGRREAFAIATSTWDASAAAYRCEPPDGLERLRADARAAAALAGERGFKGKIDAGPDVPYDRLMFAVNLLAEAQAVEIVYSGIPFDLMSRLSAGAITSRGR